MSVCYNHQTSSYWFDTGLLRGQDVPLNPQFLELYREETRFLGPASSSFMTCLGAVLINRAPQTRHSSASRPVFLTGRGGAVLLTAHICFTLRRASCAGYTEHCWVFPLHCLQKYLHEVQRGFAKAKFTSGKKGTVNFPLIPF